MEELFTLSDEQMEAMYQRLGTLYEQTPAPDAQAGREKNLARISRAFESLNSFRID
jgi:hypothetical protein